MNKIIHFTLLFFIIIFAVFLRVYHIDTVPPGLYPDEANNAVNAYDAQKSGHYLWFYPDNNGREGLYINLMALSIKYFGINPLAIKLPSIVLGVLTVLGIFLLTRELFPSRARIALLAAYLSAGSFWLVNFSRIGFRAILMLPVLTFSFYFFFRGIRTKRHINYLVSGLLFGIGFHSYIAFRIAPVLFLAVIFLLLLIEKTVLKHLWKALLLFFFGACLTAAPMFWTLYEHPEYANARTSDINILHAQDRSTIPQQLLLSITKSLGKYNIYGDPNFRHNYAPYPLLEPLTGIAFLAGFWIALAGFFRFMVLRFRKDIRNRHLVIYGFLLAWFILFLIPEFLTNEGLPHALRSIGTLPVVYIFSALGINTLIDWVLYKRTQTKKLLLAIIAIALFSIGAFNAIKYHVFWARHPPTAVAFHQELRDVAQALPQYPPYKEKIIVTGWLKRLSIDLFSHDIAHVSYVHPNDVAHITMTRNTIVFLPTPRQDLIDTIKRSNPQKNIIIETHPQKNHLSFITLRLARDKRSHLYPLK